jgi:hypothetical protein
MASKDVKAELLEHYGRKDPCTFQQYDAFTGVEPGDCIVRPDNDGDCLFAGITEELMSGVWSVRVFVTDGTSKADALRALKKIIAWMESGEYEQLAKYSELRKLDIAALALSKAGLDPEVWGDVLG